MKLAIALLAIVMTGCATAPETTSMLLDAQVKLASKSTLSINCPSGCSVDYTDPRDRAAAIKMPTNGYDVANSLINRTAEIVSGAVIPVTFGYVATEGFKAMKGHGTTTTSTDTHNADSHNVDTHNMTDSNNDRHDTTTDSHDADNTHIPTVVYPVVVDSVMPQ